MLFVTVIVLKVSGLPKKMDKNELVTHLRSHGVLGISQVALQPDHTAIVRFNEERDVPKAISKAQSTVFKEKKLLLEPMMSTWDTLFPYGEADERGMTAGPKVAPAMSWHGRHVGGIQTGNLRDGNRARGKGIGVDMKAATAATAAALHISHSLGFSGLHCE
eukprot:s3172_g9.t1